MRNTLHQAVIQKHSLQVKNQYLSNIHGGNLKDKERLKEEQNPLPTKFINEAESVDCDKKSALPEPEKKGGRRKINIEFIENKNRRHVTFSKRKTGLIKKVSLI